MMLQGKLYIFNHLGCKLEIREHIKEPLPILWNRKGEFCIIQEAVVKNAIDDLAMSNKIEGKVIWPMVTIHWDQGMPISSEIGRALLGE